MMEFQITRELPPPLGDLSDEEHRELLDALPALEAGNAGPLLRALEDVLESRLSEQEFGDYQLFCDDHQLSVLQRVAEQVPELAGVRLEESGM